MKRSELETKHFKDKTQESLFSKKKQKNFSSKLYEKERKKYYNRIDNKYITDSKIFWKLVQPFLTDQVSIQFKTHQQEMKN